MPRRTYRHDENTDERCDEDLPVRNEPIPGPTKRRVVLPTPRSAVRLSRAGLRASRARAGTVGSMWAAVLLSVSPPAAVAEPDEPSPPGSPRDALFVQDLDRIGIPYRSAVDAIGVAREVCAAIAGGHSIRDAVNEVRASDGSLSVLQGAHFVWVARSVYCPGHRSAL